MSTPSFTEEQVRRYARHIILPGIGGEGQRKLLDAKVLCIGAGGLGSPVAMYLAAAGVGTLGILDFDRVDESNLQRQIIHSTADVGRPKVESAADRLRLINPTIEVVPYDTILTSQNAFEILEAWDVVVDGTDNFPVRYLVNDATQFLGKPLVYGSIYQWDGQATVFMPGRDAPCYRCLFPQPPPPGTSRPRRAWTTRSCSCGSSWARSVSSSGPSLAHTFFTATAAWWGPTRRTCSTSPSPR